jgi:membrane protein implicated in regulation of membrane protease activity
VGERFLDTEEATGSIPVSPTTEALVTTVTRAFVLSGTSRPIRPCRRGPSRQPGGRAHDAAEDLRGRRGKVVGPLGEPASVPHGGWRHRVRSNPTTYRIYRVPVFVVGLLCIAAGFALSVLPGR